MGQVVLLLHNIKVSVQAFLCCSTLQELSPSDSLPNSPDNSVKKVKAVSFSRTQN